MLAVLIALVAMQSCTTKNTEIRELETTQFGIFCEQFTLLAKNTELSDLSTVERARELDRILLEKITPSSNVYLAWSAIINAEPSQRAMLYKGAASNVGIEDWNCPAVEQYASKVGT